MHNFKNDGQMEISTFPRFLIKMLNFSILDHIYCISIIQFGLYLILPYTNIKNIFMIGKLTAFDRKK